jgi:hypothetical protein
MDHGYINSDTDSSLKLLEEIFQHIGKDDEIEMTIICSSLPPFLFHTNTTTGIRAILSAAHA